MAFLPAEISDYIRIWASRDYLFYKFSTKGKFNPSELKELKDFPSERVNEKRALCQLFIWSRYDDLPEIIKAVNQPKFTVVAKYPRVMSIMDGFLLNHWPFASRKILGELLVRAYADQFEEVLPVVFQNNLPTEEASLFPEWHPVSQFYDVYQEIKKEGSAKLIATLQEDISNYVESMRV